MPSDFIKAQQELFVEPFLNAINNQISEQKALLQLILNKDMVNDNEYSSDLLNWITGLDRIDGAYIIPDFNPRTKQIKDPELLYSFLNFVYALSSNEMSVVLGYLNTDGVLILDTGFRMLTV